MGLFLYFLVSLFYAVSTSVTALIILRLGQGVAAAMVLPVAQAYVGEMIPPDREGRLMGLFNVSLFGGLSAGPVLGGSYKRLAFHPGFLCRAWEFLLFWGFSCALSCCHRNERQRPFHMNQQ